MWRAGPDEVPALDPEMDEDLFHEGCDTLALLAGIEMSDAEVEPWQRLEAVLGRLTGELAVD